MVKQRKKRVKLRKVEAICPNCRMWAHSNKSFPVYLWRCGVGYNYCQDVLYTSMTPDFLSCIHKIEEQRKEVIADRKQRCKEVLKEWWRRITNPEEVPKDESRT